MRTNLQRISVKLLLPVIVFYSSTFEAHSGDWLTFGSDPQRSGWAFSENKLSTQNVANLELKWKTPVKNQPKSLTALTAPVVATNVTTPQGVKTLVFVAGTSNNVFALESTTGTVIWTRALEVSSVPKNEDFWLCPQGINATPVIDRNAGILFVIGADGRLFGIDLGTGKTKFGPIQFVPPFSKSWSLNLVDGIVYTSLSQGCGGAQSGLYAMDVRDPFRPSSRALLVSQSGRGGIWGRGGPVIGSGKVFAATGDGDFDPSARKYGSSIIAASLKDLMLVDYFTPANWVDVNRYDWDIGCTSAVFFPHQTRNLLAVGGKEGVVYLMDADDLGGKDHHTSLYTTPRLANDSDTFEGSGVWGGLSAWQDEHRVSWVYVPIWGPASAHAPKFRQTNGVNPNGSIMAFRVSDEKGAVTLEAAWVSGDFNVPEPVVVANGVLFGLSSGENVHQTKEGGVIFGRKLSTLSDLQRTENTDRAVLRALDARTGKVLFDSGNSFDTWTHFSGIAVADGCVYAVDFRSQVYCFGLRKG